MKKQILLAGTMALLTTGVMTSCSNNDDVQAPNIPGNEIRLAVAGINTRSTEDAQNTSLYEGNTVGVFGVYADNSDFVNNGNNNAYTVGSGNTLNPTTPMTATEGANVNVYAYAPYQAAWVNNYDQENSFSVSANQSTVQNYVASDLLYATASNATPGSQVDLTFNHKLAKLVVKFVNNNSNEIDLANATVTVNAATTATFNPSTGTVGTASNVADITAATNLGSNTAYVILVPQTIDAGSFVTISDASDNNLVASLASQTTFDGGKVYTFTVTINGNEAELTLGDATVNDWEDGNGDLGGDTEEVEPAEETLAASFKTSKDPGNRNFTYEGNLFSWTATNNNFMYVFEFNATPSESIANTLPSQYKSLVLEIGDMNPTGTRVCWYDGYTTNGYTGSSNTIATFYGNGKKVIDLTKLSNADKIIAFGFGGSTSGTGSCTLVESSMYLSSYDAAYFTSNGYTLAN